MYPDLSAYLSQSSARHSHLCPRQVIGVRMGLLALKLFGFDCPPSNKRLLVITETDGCLVDGIQVVTGASVGHRTLRVVDYGKIAAVFTDVCTGQSLRLAPLSNVRERARVYAPDEPRRYIAQLQAYQCMPDDELLSVRSVILNPPADVLISRPGVRVACVRCGEEIINEREVYRGGLPFCRACAGQEAYYVPDELTEASLFNRNELMPSLEA